MPAILNRQSRNERVPDVTSKSHIGFRDMGTSLNPRRTTSTVKQTGSKHRPIDDLMSFVYQYYSDTPEEVIETAVEALTSIIIDANTSDEEKKKLAEDLLAQPLTISDFDRLRTLIRESESVAENSIHSASSSDSEDFDPEEPSPPAEPLFLSLNDILRVSDKETVNPQDIDRQWLFKKLEPTTVDTPSVMEMLESLQDASYEDRLIQLEAKLGVANYSLAKLLAKNAEIVYWYTKLAQADSNTDREQILGSIKSRNIDYEQVANTQMDQDKPAEVDLNFIGKPVEVPIHLNVSLPKGSTKFTTHDYEQYNIPSESTTDVTSNWKRTPISTLPSYAQPLFDGMDTLNIVQSQVSDTALQSDDNILLCAPTGAGKTNVALLALAKCLFVHQSKAVYISPLKALVQEQVATLASKFDGLDVSVAELSGDQALGRDQLKSVDVLVSTPEKWDIITRKLTNAELVRDVGLVIIDEIHLLHDKRRGRVIENIVTRHKLLSQTSRLVGLSATLPNYGDVAKFLKVEQNGLFFFDARFRPVPLEQKFVGVYAQGPLKQARAINQACADKISDLVVTDGKQALVFVHSRKDTGLTRQFLAENTKLELSQIGTHHAGLDRATRAEAEQLFRDGKSRVLVCTATLAWGVNLPAAAVIIKGTQYYDSGLDGWKQLEPQDVMQMLGRAGRPGFDSSGVGVILTTQKYLGYFASVATLSFPIQSHLVANVADSLNAEIVNYNIKNVKEGLEWLKETFWYVRFKTDPDMYGDDYDAVSIVHSAFLKLHQTGACIYDYPNVEPVFAGDIASRFYISPESVATFIQQLKPWLQDMDLMRVFARAAEFSGIVLRRGEIGEVSRLANLVPIPLRDPVDSRYAKICILLQAYISRLPLEGLALGSDMAYIAQSATRLYRAFFEIAVALKWSRLAQVAHRFYMMVDKKLWITGASPLRQFVNCPDALIERAERSRLPWSSYFDLTEADLADTLRLDDPNLASKAFELVRKFPRFDMSGSIRPLNMEWALLSLEIQPLFEYDEEIHENSEQFWVFAETQSGEVLSSLNVSLKAFFQSSSQGSSINRTTVIKVRPNEQTQRYPPFAFAKIVSERWLHAQNSTSLNMRKFVPPNQAFAVSSIESEDPTTFEEPALKGVLRVLVPLLASERNVYIGLPPSAERQSCIESAVEFATRNEKTVLVISSSKAEPDTPYVRYMKVADAERISRLPTRLARELGDIDHVLCDDLDMLGLANGYLYELLVTRLKNLPNVTRLIGFGNPVTSAQSVAQWLDASRSDVVNFGLDVLEENVDIQIRKSSGFRNYLPDLHSIFEVARSQEPLLLLANTAKECRVLEHELRMFGVDDVSVSNENRVIISPLSDLPTIKASCVVLFGATSTRPQDVLTAISHSSHRAIIFGDNPEYLKHCVENVIPLESMLDLHFVDGLVPGICSRAITNPQDAVEWLSSTLLYRRLRSNPSYYGCKDLQEWVSDAIETSFIKLKAMGAVNLDEELLEVEPTAIAHIASTYGVNVADLLNDSAGDFESLQLREDKLYVLDARIDAAIAQNRLDGVLGAIDLRQAISREVPPTHSPLYQIPHFDENVILRCSDAGINSVQDFISIEDDDLRIQLLGFDETNPKMLEIAEFVNNFPIVDITDIYMEGSDTLIVSIEREIDSDDPIKDDAWYILVGKNGSNSIMGFQRIPPISEPELSVGIELNESLGSLRDITVWLMCGNYIEADKEFSRLTK